MSLKDRINRIPFVEEMTLGKKYGSNIHDMGLNESIEKDLVERLMKAREMGIPYCVVFGGITPMTKTWDQYGDGTWNPPRRYITTDDIATEDNDLDKERENIYAFLRGEQIEKEKGKSR